MKLLLTSAGFTNRTISEALVALVGKPPSQAQVVVIPTAQNAALGDKTWVVEEDYRRPSQLGWKSFNIVDIAAVAALDRKFWWPQLVAADVIIVGGGATFYLSYWLQQSGLSEALPAWLEDKVYVGISAGSQVAGANLRTTGEALDAGPVSDAEYDEIGPPGQSSGKALRLVEFVVRPHFNSPNFPKIRLGYLSEVAKSLDVSMYALDDESAVVVDGTSTRVVSEGNWHVFTK